MKLFSRKAVVAAASALALSTTTITAAPAFAQDTPEAQLSGSSEFSSGLFGQNDTNDDNNSGSGSSGLGSSENEKDEDAGEGGSDKESVWDQVSTAVKAITTVVGLASSIYGLLKKVGLV